MPKNSSSEKKIIQSLIEIGKRLYQRGLIVGNEGNLSAKFSAKRIFITRSGSHKGFLTSSDILLMDSNGKKITGKGEVSSEKKFHLFIYQKRPEISAILHPHPPYAISCTLAGVSFEKPFMAETEVALGAIPTVPYATPTTQEIVKAIAQKLKNHRALLLEKHGAITLGKTLEQCFSAMEILEQTARIYCIAKSLGEIEPLGVDEMKRLRAIL